jgi:hypothetical protein
MRHRYVTVAIILVFVALSALAPLLVVAENGNVVLLESLPNIGESGAQAPNLGDYLDGLFKLALGVATGLAVVMIVIGGVEYMGSESVFKKDAGREKIQDALWGLLLALGAFLLLQTINPALVRFDIVNTLQRVVDKAGEGVPPRAGCTNCVPLPADIPTKPGICGGGRCQLEPGFVESLRAFGNRLFTEGIRWRITEGYPPTVNHQNQCHYNGTCVDANFIGTLVSASEIRTVIEAASQSLMTACYEVNTPSERDRLIGQGVPSQNIKAISGITESHFSIYGYRTGC